MIENGHISVEELRDVLRDPLTAYDHEYERAIAAASRQIDAFFCRHLHRTSLASRTFCPDRTDLEWCGNIATPPASS